MIKIGELEIRYPEGEKEELFAKGIYEEIFIQKIYGEIENGDIVIDCGSNIGLFAKYASNKASKIICIDPNESIIDSFNFNCKDDMDKIIFYQKALWNRSGINLYLDPYYFSAGANIAETKTRDTKIVETITIDDIVEELQLERVDLIKMDIEGSEIDALLGSEKTIMKFKPRLALSLYHNKKDRDDINDILRVLNIPYTETVIFHENPCPNSNPDRYQLSMGHYNFKNKT